MSELPPIPSHDQLFAQSEQLLRDYGTSAVDTATSQRFGPLIRRELDAFGAQIQEHHQADANLPSGVVALHTRGIESPDISYRFLGTPNVSLALLSWSAGRMVGDALHIYESPAHYNHSSAIIRANSLYAANSREMFVIANSELEENERSSLRERLRFAATIGPLATAAEEQSQRRRTLPVMPATRARLRSVPVDLDL